MLGGRARFIATAAAGGLSGTTPSGTAVYATTLTQTSTDSTSPASIGAGTVGWTNLANAVASDSLYATNQCIVIGNQPQQLNYVFGGIIPSSATPTGFVITVVGSDDGGSGSYPATIRPAIKLGGTWSLITSTNFTSTTGATATFGSSSTFPSSGSYTAANINGMTLALSLRSPQVSPGPGYTNNVGVNYVSVTVYYS